MPATKSRFPRVKADLAAKVEANGQPTALAVRALYETPLTELPNVQGTLAGAVHLSKLRTVADVVGLGPYRHRVFSRLMEQSLNTNQADVLMGDIETLYRRVAGRHLAPWKDGAGEEAPATPAAAAVAQKPDETIASKDEPTVSKDETAAPAGAMPWDLVRLELIDPSPFNPRKTFDQAGLQELAVSIKAKGVLQPILCRSVGERVQIVAGERRFRAAKLAGLTSIPAIVRHFGDREVLEIQVIENEQRSDVAPLEKADGYWQLTKLGLSIEDLAQRIGKSTATIYGLLKLRELPKQARKALETGELPATTAQLIARIPSEELRIKAAKEIVGGHEWIEGTLSYRQAKEHIREHYMVELKDAPFDRKALDLVPSAGACTACPKMTGNNRDLFPDARGDICTDPGCWRDKMDAHQAKRTAALRAEGVAFLEGQAAHRACYSSDYVKLDEKCWEDKKHRTYGQLLGKAIDAGTLQRKAFVDDHDDAIREIVPRAAAEKVLKDAGVVVLKKRTEVSSHSARAAQDRAMAKAKLELMGKAAAAVEGLGGLRLGFDSKATELVRAIARGLVDHSWAETARAINRRRGIEAKARKMQYGGADHRGGLQDLVDTLDGPAVLGLLAEVAASRYAPSHWSSLDADGRAFFKTLGIDAAKVVADAKRQPAKKKAKAK